MKERPILFNTEMVKAILDGRKTMTRRIIKFPINRFTKNIPIADNVSFRQIRSGKAYFNEEPFFGFDVKSPYSVGDTLYIRETWYKDIGRYMYRASYSNQEKFYRDGKEIEMKWHPSIHMPKEAARIFLKVTDVRVERLQEMDCKDAMKEGVDPRLCINLKHTVVKFQKLWNSTIKKSDLERYGWEANPWVWVIEFEQCEKPLECEFNGYDKAPDDGSGKCLGYMYDNEDALIPMCEKCMYQASYESEE